MDKIVCTKSGLAPGGGKIGEEFMISKNIISTIYTCNALKFQVKF